MLALLLSMAVQSTAPATARLEYAAPEGCPAADVARAAVAARLGYDPFVEDTLERVTLTVTSMGARFRGELTTGASAPRVFESESCVAVVESAAVAAALALDPASAFGATEPPRALPVPEKAREPSRLDDVVAPPAPAAVRLLAYGAPFVDVGLAPGVGVGAVVGGGVRIGAFSVAAEGRIDAPREVRVSESSFVDVFAAGGGALACGHLDPIAVCGAALLADYVVTGRGLDDARTDHGLIVAVGPRVVAELPLWRALTIGAFIEGLFVPIGVRVADPAGTELFTTSPVVGALGLRVGGVW